jgi:cytidylate kinase
MPLPKIIGVAGTNGSGKDTAGRMLAERYSFLFISMTDMLREELDKRSLPSSRENMRNLSAEWRRESVLGVLVDKAVTIYKQKGGDQKFSGLVVASLRNPGEADRVHGLNGLVLWVDADPRVRYERIQTNLQNRGAHRAIDDQKTFEQFVAEETAEMNHSGDAATLSMIDVKARSDLKIYNNTTDIDTFSNEIERVLNLK